MTRRRIKRHAAASGATTGIECKQCGQCCGLIPVSNSEIAAINEYTKGRVVPNTHSEPMCPFLAPAEKGVRRCLIYPVRPGICRAFPHSKRMTCPHGACGKLREDEVVAIAMSGGVFVTTLNEHYGGLNGNAYGDDNSAFKLSKGSAGQVP